MAIRGAGRPSDAISARWVEKNPLGAALRLARGHRGLTQQEMSEALRDLPVDLGRGEVLRASQATISKYEGAGGRQTVHKLLRGYSLVLGYHPTALKSLAGLLVVELESLREEQRSVTGDHWEAFAERVLGRIDTWHALSLEGNPQALAVVGPAGGLGPLARAPEDETDAGSIGPTFRVTVRPLAGKHALERRPAAGWLAGLPPVLRTPLRRGAVVALVLAVASIGVVAVPPLLTGKAAHLTHGKASPTVGPSVSAEASSSGAGGDPGGPTPTALPQSGSNAGLGSDNHTGAKPGTTKPTPGSSASQGGLLRPLVTGSPWASVIPPLTLTKSPTAQAPIPGSGTPPSPGPSPSSGHQLAMTGIQIFPVATQFSLGGIAAGPDGNMWFVDTQNEKIGNITGSGVVTEFDPPNPMAALSGIAAGSDGNLWFTAARANYIGMITPSGTYSRFQIPPVTGTYPPTTGPGSITSGPDGNLWFTEESSMKIGRITTSGVVTEFGPLSCRPNDIVTGPDQQLWFTCAGTYDERIGTISTSGTFGVGPIDIPQPSPSPPGTGTDPKSITLGSDGNVWFTQPTGNEVARMIPATKGLSEVTMPTPSAKPGDLAMGPDGAIWVTEDGVGKLARVSLQGAVTEYAIPSPGSQPTAITAGPDGSLWFTDSGSHDIGHVTFG